MLTKADVIAHLTWKGKAKRRWLLYATTPNCDRHPEYFLARQGFCPKGQRLPVHPNTFRVLQLRWRGTVQSGLAQLLVYDLEK